METPDPLKTLNRPEAAVAASPTIRTPDQRVRVFVSSTLDELAAERAAAIEAITQLRLTPSSSSWARVRTRRVSSTAR